MSQQAWEPLQQRVFTAGIRLVGCGLVVRDRWLGRIQPGRGLAAAERVWLASGTRWLDGVWVRPVQGVDVRAAVLICHGIGEVVEHWARSQELLAEHGVSSLVFNYSGCGRSGGSVSVERCEQDAMAACFWLRERLPGVQIILLGFSLGSGVAAAVVGRVPVAGLVMGEAYPSFREAVRVAGAPSWVTGLVPDAWRSEETLGVCKVPVLVVHGECDRLFPVSMGERLARAAGQRGKLVVVPGMGHSDLHAQARAGDWQAIVSFVCEIAPPGKSEIKA